MIGTSEKANGGITAVIKLMKKMTVWEKYSVYWLATQTNEVGRWSKLWMALVAAIKAPFVIWHCKIVHFHMVPGISLLIQLPELFVAKLLHKRVILEVHIGDQLEIYATNKFFKWWLRRADLILLLAKRWEELFKSYYSDIKVRVDVLYNACDVIPHIPLDKKQKLIMFAGTHDTNKSPDLLIKAWSKLSSKNPDWHLAFLGSGNLDYYKKMAQDLGISECVEFTGYITGERKDRYFNDASVLCLCSYKEGFPMAVLEAWSHSIAVITTPVGGLPDVIEDGTNCLTFPMGDYDSLAKQLERLINDRRLLTELSDGGYQCAKNNFSLSAINTKLEDVYSGLINDRS